MSKIASKKIQSRQRRSRRARGRIKTLQIRNPELIRVSIHRTLKHFYAQAIKQDALDKTSTIITSASSTEAKVKTDTPKTGNIESSANVGKVFAERLKKAGISKIAFDRSGFKYHGRVKAFADALREAGIEF